MLVTNILARNNQMKKTLRWFLDKERAEPLSVERLKSYAFRPKLKFVYYAEIESRESLDELIGAGDGACIILWDVGAKKTQWDTTR